MQADQMSMWHLISSASVLVQLVMLILMAASVVSWVLIFQRSSVTRAARRSLDDFEDRFWSGIDLSKLYRQVSGTPNPDSGLEQIFREGYAYAKAEMLLMDLRQKGQFTDDLFAATQPASAERVMSTMDAINARWGKGTLRSALVPTTAEWGMKQDLKSPSYTTSWQGLWCVKCR